MNLYDIINGLQSAPASPPACFPIKPQNTDYPQRLASPFRENEHYFLVQINEMFLARKRQWFHEYMPVVYTSAEFSYGSSRVETPFVVGPSLLQAQMKDIAKDVVFRDTTVAGWHPYTGDKLVLTVLLCRAKTNDYLQRALGFVEKVSGVFQANVVTMLNNSISISKVVIDGLNTLIDSKDVTGVACFRQEFDAAKNNGFYPGYFLLMEEDLPEADKDKFFVKGNRLFYGRSVEEAKPYRERDFVLFNIEQNTTRNDYKSFAFYKLFQQAQTLALKKPVNDARKEEIIQHLDALLLAMLQSPDMIEPHAQALADDAYEKIKALVEKNYKLSEDRSKPEKEDAFWKQMRAKVRSL